MQTLKLLKEHQLQIPFILGDELGYGSDGQCFEICGLNDKVIKISGAYSYEPFYNCQYTETSKVLDYLIINDDPAYVRVHAHMFLGSFPYPIKDGKCNLYYYTMDKLKKISEDEKKVFHTILSHEDKNIVKNYSPPQIKKILSELHRGLDFDFKKITFFCDSLRASKVHHQDLHIRNVMKDLQGNFKLVDLDRAQLNIGD